MSFPLREEPLSDFDPGPLFEELGLVVGTGTCAGWGAGAAVVDGPPGPLPPEPLPLEPLDPELPEPLDPDPLDPDPLDPEPLDPDPPEPDPPEPLDPDSPEPEPEEPEPFEPEPPDPRSLPVTGTVGAGVVVDVVDGRADVRRRARVLVLGRGRRGEHRRDHRQGREPDRGGARAEHAPG